MKPAFLALTLMLVTAGFSFAADTQDLQRMPRNRSVHTVRPNAYFMGRYSRNLTDLFQGALKMDLTDQQKTKVSALNEKYTEQMSKDESQVKRLKLNLPKMLNDPSFDPAKVKEEIGKVDSLNKKISDNYVDALASLRDTIGKENYKTLTTSLYRYRDDLIQMRRNRSSVELKQGTMKSVPSKTEAPPSTETKN